MEVKQILYTGADTEDVTRIMEEGERKMAAKGWREGKVDMLSSSTVQVSYYRGPEEEEEEGGD